MQVGVGLVNLLQDLQKAEDLKLDELVSRTYPMEDISSTFEDMHNGELARGVLDISAEV